MNKKTDKQAPYFFRVFAARPRLVISLVVGILCSFVIPESWAHQDVTRAIIGWNLGASLYIALAMRMMFWSSHDKMKERAQLEDEGQALILILVIAAVTATLASIVMELATVKGLHGKMLYGRVALSAFSIVTAWSFTHIMFALHYAHDYYAAIAEHRRGGLIFPDDDKPDYTDFLYFSFVIGTSGQTADVNFASKSMRRTGLVHCVMAFFFNTTLLALTINIAAGLI